MKKIFEDPEFSVMMLDMRDVMADGSGYTDESGADGGSGKGGGEEAWD